MADRTRSEGKMEEHHQPAVILISSSEDEGVAEEKREVSECCCRSVDCEFRILANLSGFDNLRTVLEAERDYVKRKKRKRKRKRKRKVGYGAPEKEVVDVSREEMADKGFGSVSNMTLDNIEVDAEKEMEQVDGVRAVGTAEPFKELQEEMVPADTIVLKRRRRRRRRRRKKDKMIKACEAICSIGSVLRERKDKSGGTVTASMGTESVGIKDNIVLRKLLRGPRYFDPPCSSSDECLKCGEVHAAWKCTVENRKKPCCLCGGFDHSWKNCTQGLDCFACKGRGHRAKQCPEKNQGDLDQPCCEICLRCGESGHDMLSCTASNYSLDDLEEIQCYVCKKFGHLCCVDFQDVGPNYVSCYNCGQDDHLGSDCKEPRGNTRVASCKKCKEEGHSARRCPNKLKRVTLGPETEVCTGSSSRPANLDESMRKNQCEEAVTAITTMA